MATSSMNAATTAGVSHPLHSHPTQGSGAPLAPSSSSGSSSRQSIEIRREDVLEQLRDLGYVHVPEDVLEAFIHELKAQVASVEESRRQQKSSSGAHPPPSAAPQSSSSSSGPSGVPTESAVPAPTSSAPSSQQTASAGRVVSDQGSMGQPPPPLVQNQPQHPPPVPPSTLFQPSQQQTRQPAVPHGRSDDVGRGGGEVDRQAYSTAESEWQRKNAEYERRKLEHMWLMEERDRLMKDHYEYEQQQAAHPSHRPSQHGHRHGSGSRPQARRSSGHYDDGEEHSDELNVSEDDEDEGDYAYAGNDRRGAAYVDDEYSDDADRRQHHRQRLAPQRSATTRGAILGGVAEEMVTHRRKKRASSSKKSKASASRQQAVPTLRDDLANQPPPFRPSGKNVVGTPSKLSDMDERRRLSSVNKPAVRGHVSSVQIQRHHTSHVDDENLMRGGPDPHDLRQPEYVDTRQTPMSPMTASRLGLGPARRVASARPASARRPSSAQRVRTPPLHQSQIVGVNVNSSVIHAASPRASARPASASRKRHHDPVSSYHRMQDVWSRDRFLVQDKRGHKEVRWAVRCQMLSQPVDEGNWEPYSPTSARRPATSGTIRGDWVS